MHMIMFVLDNPNQLDEVLYAWREVGVCGATIMESTGLHRRQRHVLGARYLPSLPQLVERVEEGHYTLIGVVPEAQTVQACLAATESVVGDLAEPNTGILVSWQVDFAKGVLDQAVQAEDGE